LGFTVSETVLFLVRHGATQANVVRPYVLQGLRPDSELIEVGIAQARAAAKALRAYPISAVYCSPLQRAWRTAEIIAAPFSLSAVNEPGLIEVDTGLWSGLSWEEISQRWPEQYRAFQGDSEQHGYLGGDNLAAVRERALPVVEQLVAQHPGETIVAVAHGVVNRVLLTHWLGLPLRFARRLPQDNGCINVIEFQGGQAKVRTVNAIGHLARLGPIGALAGEAC
jgi:broad specificity phosphatase PhoE